jgi:hypothetical protein
MKPIFYLVTVLLETSDTCITDEHHLYASYDDAQRAFNYEVEPSAKPILKVNQVNHSLTFKDAASGAILMATALQ